MNIDLPTLGYIQNVIKTAKLVGLDALIIEPGMIRGVDVNATRVILHKTDVQELPFGSIAISRLDVFTERLELAKGVGTFTVEVKTQGEDPTIPTEKTVTKAMFAKQLTYKGKGLKLEFKASNPSTIKAPRNLNDRMKYSVQMTPEVLVYLQKAKTAFGTDEFDIVLDENGASITLVDINNDQMSFTFTDTVTNLVADDTTTPTMTRRFPIAIFLPLLKLEPTSTLQFSERTGYAQLLVNNLNVCIMPRV